MRISLLVVTIILSVMPLQSIAAENTEEEVMDDCVKHELRVHGEKVQKGQNIVIEDGQNITLSLCSGGKSADCYIDLNDQPMCEVKENSTIIDCDNEKMKNFFNGNNSAKNCQVTIKNVTQEFEGNIKLRVKFSQNEINFKFHKRFTDMEVTFGSEKSERVIENKKSTVVCSVKDGIPIPKLKLMLMKDNHTAIANTELRFHNVTTTFLNGTLIFESSFTPVREDQGLFIGCQAEQFDDLGNSSLYKENKMLDTPLHVLYSPSKIGEPTIIDETASIVVESNPAPTSVDWLVNCEDDQKCPFHLILKENDVKATEKFATAYKEMITARDSKIQYNLRLSLSSNSWLVKANVSVTITNSLGSIYEDNIQIYKVQEENLEQKMQDIDEKIQSIDEKIQDLQHNIKVDEHPNNNTTNLPQISDKATSSILKTPDYLILLSVTFIFRIVNFF